MFIAFDADDTLWHTEVLFARAQDQFKQLLSQFRDVEDIEQGLCQTEIRNLQHYGYGIKGFTLSMIEAAIELTSGQVTSREIQKTIGIARGMLGAPVQPLERVGETLAQLSGSHELMLITKGDLFEQENKITHSDLAHHFTHVEIVSEKTSDVYKTILAKHNIEPESFLMVGN